MPVIGPKSGCGGKYLSHGLSKAAKVKAHEAFRENPAFSSLKMKGKKRNLPTGNKRSAYMEEMQDMGKE